MHTHFFYYWPVTLVGLVLVLVFAAFLEVGAAWGRHKRRESAESDAQGDLVLTSMLALLGLVLAFTYGFAVNHYEVRKQVVIEEANALGTAFQRCDLTAEPGRGELRRALLEFARTRIVEPERVDSQAKVEDFLGRTEEALAALWPATRRVLEAESSEPVRVALAGDVTQVLDLHDKRVAVSFDHLPRAVLALLVLLAGASLGVAGYGVGRAGEGSRWRLGVFALALAAVILVIVDFDRGTDGFVQVSQESLRRVVADMEAGR